MSYKKNYINMNGGHTGDERAIVFDPPPTSVKK